MLNSSLCPEQQCFVESQALVLCRFVFSPTLKEKCIDFTHGSLLTRYYVKKISIKTLVAPGGSRTKSDKLPEVVALGLRSTVLQIKYMGILS